MTAFGASPPLALGVEEEFVLVGPDGLPRAGSDLLLDGARVGVAGSGELQPELFTSMVEVATLPVASVEAAGAALRALRAELVERAAQHDLRLLASGTHPLVDGAGLQITAGARYEAIAGQLDELMLLDDQLACGMHVHVAMPTAELALAATQQLSALAPVFIGLAANSPWWQERATAMSTVRSELQRRLPWAALAPHDLDFATWQALDDPTHERLALSARLRWEVTPVARYGTVEVRVMDVQHDPDRALALVALVQAICAHVVAGETLAVRPPTVIEQANRWSAIIAGAAGRIELPGRAEPVAIADLARELVATVRDAATDLGSADALDGIEALIAETGADRQRRLAAAGGADALVQGLVVTAS